MEFIMKYSDKNKKEENSRDFQFYFNRNRFDVKLAITCRYIRLFFLKEILKTYKKHK